MSKKTTFFIDIALGSKELLSYLTGMGLSVERHLDHFPPDAADAQWIPDVSSRGWAILTADKNIRRRAQGARVVRYAGARLFVLSCHTMSPANWRRIIEKHARTAQIVAAYLPPPYKTSLTLDQMKIEWLGTDEELANLLGT